MTGAQILVVDDDPTFRMTTAALLLLTPPILAALLIAYSTLSVLMVAGQVAINWPRPRAHSKEVHG